MVKAGTPDGIDSVTVTLSLETKTLSIQANDGAPSKVVTVLVNKAFIDTHIAVAEASLSLSTSLRP